MNMKKIILTIIILVTIALASYITTSKESHSFILKTFVIEGNKQNTETGHNNLMKFEMGQEQTGRTKLMHMLKQTINARKRNIKYQQKDEEINKCINKVTKNWKRTYYRKSYEKVYDKDEEKWKHTERSPFPEREFYGYDEDEDFRLRWHLRNKALNEEKIC